jgi:hypothetical protein
MRPVFHVESRENTSVAITSGTQPPCRTFNRFAPKNARSIVMKTAVITPAVQRLQCHTCRATTYARIVVIPIVAVTAIP